METKAIKVGTVLLEVKTDQKPPVNPYSPNATIKAHKPDEPEELEKPQYIFRPNDPFGIAIDRAEAMTRIGTSDKSWVNWTGFLIFVVIPSIAAEIFAIAVGVRQDSWWFFIFLNAVLGYILFKKDGSKSKPGKKSG